MTIWTENGNYAQSLPTMTIKTILKLVMKPEMSVAKLLVRALKDAAYILVRIYTLRVLALLAIHE